MRVRVALVVLALSSVQCARIAGLGDGNQGTGSSGSAPGDGTGSDLEVSPASLTFDPTACGNTTVAQLVTLHNKGTDPAPYQVQIPSGAAFHLDPPKDHDLSGTIAGGEFLTFSAAATPALAGDSAADVVFGGGATVHATVTGTGPTMELDPPVVPFGEVRKQDGSKAQPVTINNRGTDALVVTAMTSSDPSFTQVGVPVTVAAGQSAMFTVKLEPNATTPDAMPLNATMTPAFGTKICGSAPVLALSGQRITSDVTITAPDWGRQTCGTTPDGIDLVISNYSTKVVTYTLMQAAGSQFDAITPTTGMVPIGSQSGPSVATIHIQPKQLSVTDLSEINEVLGFQLQSDLIDEHRDVTLHVAPHGIILVLDPPAIAFMGGNSLGLSVKNVGNDNLDYLLWSFQNINPSNSGKAWNGSLPFSVAAGSTVPSKVSFSPPGPGSYSATLVPGRVIGITSPPICSPFGTVVVTGKQ